MWTTADGCVLKVPGFRLRKWIEAQKRGCGASCGCRGCAESEGELVAELGRIIQGARRTGTAKGKRSGRRMPVFSVSRGRRRYRIFTRPIAGSHHTVVAVTPDPVVAPSPAASPEEPTSAPIEEPAPVEEPLAGGDAAPEEEVNRRWFSNPNVTIKWSGPYGLSDARLGNFKEPVVYILEDGAGKPIYVGKADNAKKRMNEHLGDFNASPKRGAFKNVRRIPGVTNVQARIGTVSVRPINVMETLEHAIVRKLQPNPQKPILLNDKPLAPFRAADEMIIDGIVPQGGYYTGLSPKLTIPAKALYELGAL